MSKYKSSRTNKSTASITSGGKSAPSAQDTKEEKKFFQIAIIVTILVIALIYWLLNR